VRPFQLRVQGAHRRPHVDGGAHRAQGVVVVGGRDPEDGHDRVSDEFLHRPAVALELSTDHLEVALHHGAHDLRIQRFAERRGVREIAEDDCDRLPSGHVPTLGRKTPCL
jgi:hypothetical protein